MIAFLKSSYSFDKIKPFFLHFLWHCPYFNVNINLSFYHYIFNHYLYLITWLNSMCWPLFIKTVDPVILWCLRVLEGASIFIKKYLIPEPEGQRYNWRFPVRGLMWREMIVFIVFWFADLTHFRKKGQTSAVITNKKNKMFLMGKLFQLYIFTLNLRDSVKMFWC